MIHDKDNPSAGGANDTQVSEGNSLALVDSGQLNATQNKESAAKKLAW